MSTQFDAWNIRLLALICFLALAGQCMAGDDYSERLTAAIRSYAQEQYATSLTQWQQLLTDFPQAPQSDLALLRVAQCSIAAKQLDRATQVLTALRAHYPASSYRADGTVLLYAVDLALNKQPDDDTLWNEISTQWPCSPYVLQMEAFYLQAPQIKVAEQERGKMRQVLAREQEFAELVTLLYSPLLQAGRVTEALAMHEHSQALLKLAGATQKQLDVEETAYRDSLSADAMEAMFQFFKKALTAGDTATSQHWLTALNNVSAAHPRSVEARKLYREAMNKANPAPASGPE